MCQAQVNILSAPWVRAKVKVTENVEAIRLAVKVMCLAKEAILLAAEPICLALEALHYVVDPIRKHMEKYQPY